MGGHIPENNALSLAYQYKLTTLVETGSWKCESSIWATEHFERVYTIEAYEQRFRKNSAAHAGKYPNLTMILGDSREELGRVLSRIEEPCLFWLDAHFMGQDIGLAARGECPLMEELSAIGHWAYQAPSVILIDDARLFVYPPPEPHDPAQWATFEQIKHELKRIPRTVYIDNDVIYAVPEVP